MIIAQMVAKRRVAEDVQPSFAAAWGLVLLDAVLIFGTLALMFEPIMAYIYAMQPSDQASGLSMFALYVVAPVFLLFNAVRWARRSRQRY